MIDEENPSSPKTDGKTLIEVKNLSKHFKGLKAVDDVNFSIKSGELIGIIGPNGAGKTTLFNLLSGFLKPEKGSKILLNEKNIVGKSPYKMAKLGIARTFQLVRPFKFLSALENAMVPHVPNYLTSRPSTLKNRATW